MKKMMSAALVALLACGFAATNAMADDDDDDDRDDHWHRDRCKVLSVEVTAESKLIIDGAGLTRENKVPMVLFGGMPVEVDLVTLTSEHIEADLKSIELADVPKDYLLEIQRSHRRSRCPSHLVTVVPPAANDNPIVFVTSAETTGEIGGLVGADNTCNALAAAAGLMGTFVAYLSDGVVNAIDRLPEDGGPWHNSNGDLVAATRAALITESPAGEFLDRAIRYDESGADRGPSFVWTGTEPFGASTTSDCSAWTATDVLGTTGIGNAENGSWVETERRSCAELQHLYCFQN